MDRIIEKKRFTAKKVLLYGGGIVLLLLLVAGFYFGPGKSRLNVASERITISSVTKGAFQETIPVNGVVMPVTTIYLDALEGGQVEEKLEEDGAFVKKDQPILKLSNTDLELSLANEETSVFNVLTQMQIARNNSQQNTINQLNQEADVMNSLKEAERVYNLNKKLFAAGAIGSQEMESSQNLYEYQVNRKRLNDRILAQDSISVKQGLEQMQQTYNHMSRTLELMKKKVEDLTVRAPVDGQLTSLDVEIGQSKNKGERLGQIDVMSGFKITANIDEHYISRIFTGLKGEFVFNNKTYVLVIKKVHTQVISGQFQVDLAFVKETPEGIRRGQTIQLRLALSDETQAVLLPKGSFYQATSGNWIFKINESGTMAYRVEIKLGRQNPDYFEVTEGLQPGDRVIISNYESYGNTRELVLKK
jgi:HlyD family secretion protein